MDALAVDCKRVERKKIEIICFPRGNASRVAIRQRAWHLGNVWRESRRRCNRVAVLRKNRSVANLQFFGKAPSSSYHLTDSFTVQSPSSTSSFSCSESTFHRLLQLHHLQLSFFNLLQLDFCLAHLLCLLLFFLHHHTFFIKLLLSFSSSTPSPSPLSSVFKLNFFNNFNKLPLHSLPPSIFIYCVFL